MLKKLIDELSKATDEEQAEIYKRFFKTGEGEYGEGDVFLGIKVPKQRQIAKKYNLEMEDIQKLLDSEIHEYRFSGLLILMGKELDRNIFDFYLKNSRRINNWDLVDLSAPKVVGKFLLENLDFKKIIYELAKSENLWERRIAIVSTHAFIRKNQFEDTLAISEILLGDEHDLIHKAVGWMLREVGKKDEKLLEEFLKKNYKIMPRTALRYAIEKFEEGKRKKFLLGEFE